MKPLKISLKLKNNDEPKEKLLIHLPSLSNENEAISVNTELKSTRRDSFVGDDRSVSEEQSVNNSPSSIKSHLVQLLYILKSKDELGFFLHPVDTDLVPDYLDVIPSPMDFTTMQYKVDNGIYSSLEEFKNDFELICENAMTYNSPDTPFYKSAMKLLSFGQIMIDRESKHAIETPISQRKKETKPKKALRLLNPIKGLQYCYNGSNMSFGPLFRASSQEKELYMTFVDAKNKAFIDSLEAFGRETSPAVRAATKEIRQRLLSE